MALSANIIENRNCLNLASYYQMFMEEYSKITSFINNVSGKTFKFEWTEKLERVS